MEFQQIMSTYKPLGISVIDTDITYEKPEQFFKDSVSLDDSAMEVMTDLSQVTAISVNPCASLQNATDRMITSNVQLLFVTNQHHEVMGIVTRNDLSGEKAMQHVAEAGGKMDDVMVRDIMTPRFKLEALKMEEVARARVGDLVETFKRMGRQHALVIEPSGDEQKFIIKGILSTTQLSKQLGKPVSSSHMAGSLADLAANN